MKRSVIEKFMSRYNLAREVDSVTWESDGNALTTKFKSQDGNMVGTIVQQNVGFEKGIFHIHETTTLAALLGVLGEDITLKVTRKNDVPKSIQLTDGHSTVTYALADPAAMKKSPEPREETFGDKILEFDIEKDFVDRFNRAKSALNDNKERFTLVTDPTKKIATVTIGYSKDTNSNKVTFDITPRIITDIFGPVNFSSKFLKEMMVANRDSLCGSIIAFSKGILQIEFVVPDAKIVYYLPKLND